MTAAMVVGISCAVAAVVLDFRCDGRYRRTLVQHSHDRPARSATTAFLLQLLAATTDLVVASIGHATGRPAVALAIAAYILVLHAAVVLLALPDSPGTLNYWRTRRDLVHAGASADTARAIAWAGGAGAVLVGLASVVGACSHAAH